MRHVACNKLYNDHLTSTEGSIYIHTVREKEETIPFDFLSKTIGDIKFSNFSFYGQNPKV